MEYEYDLSPSVHDGRSGHQWGVVVCWRYVYLSQLTLCACVFCDGVVVTRLLTSHNRMSVVCLTLILAFPLSLFPPHLFFLLRCNNNNHINALSLSM